LLSPLLPKKKLLKAPMDPLIEFCFISVTFFREQDKKKDLITFKKELLKLTHFTTYW